MERAVGIVMAPHWSGMSIETYVDRVEQAVAEGRRARVLVRAVVPRSPDVHRPVEREARRRPRAARAGRARGRRGDLHALTRCRRGRSPTGPCAVMRCDCADSCRYRDGLRDTADLVAERLELPHHTIAWQSAGRTADPWWGPPIEEVIARARRRRAPRGRRVLGGVRRRSPGDPVRPRHRGARRSPRRRRAVRTHRDAERGPGVLAVLAQVVRDHLGRGDPRVTIGSSWSEGASPV